MSEERASLRRSVAPALLGGAAEEDAHLVLAIAAVGSEVADRPTLGLPDDDVAHPECPVSAAAVVLRELPGEGRPERHSDALAHRPGAVAAVSQGRDI